MKRYTLSFANSLKHVPAFSERTAKRNAGTGFDFDVVFQVWTNRAAMAKTIRMQEQAPPDHYNWTACVALTGNECY